MATHKNKHNIENPTRMRHSKYRSWKKLIFLSLTALQVQSPNSLLELENKAHENIEDQHPSARSLKFRYENLEDKHPTAHSLKKYVKEIKGEV